MRDGPAKSVDMELPDLEDLTVQQRGFVMSVLDGMNYSDAYRQNYDTSNMKKETVWALASRLASNDKVRSWLEVIKLKTFELGKYTIEQHVHKLFQHYNEVMAGGNAGAGTKTLEVITNLCFKDGRERKPGNNMDMDLLSYIAQSPALGPQIASLMTKKLGYEESGTKH